jgi:hypothetical protein
MTNLLPELTVISRNPAKKTTCATKEIINITFQTKNSGKVAWQPGMCLKMKKGNFHAINKKKNVPVLDRVVLPE